MIIFDRVSKVYGDHAAVRELSFTIEHGELVGLLGLNGAGKTTTLRMLAGLLLPSAGRIEVGGDDIAERADLVRRRIGFLPDRTPLYDDMRVEAYLRFSGRLRGMTPAEVRARLPELAERCGLGAVLEESIAALSHGYRQRVGVAQALIHQPELLILDEPIQGLDPMQIRGMRELVRGLGGAHTVLLSTHHLGEIARTCDRLFLLHEGRLAAEGSVAELEARQGEVALIRVEARGEDGAIRDALAQVAGVLGVEGAGGRFSLRASRDIRADTARALVAAGFDLIHLEAEQTGLESLFVELDS